MKWDKFKEKIFKWLMGTPVHYTDEEIVSLIRKFVSSDPSMGDYDWDDFCSFYLKEPYEQFVQNIVYFIDYHFPARHKHEWCNEEGGMALLRLADAIESKTLPFPPTEEENELFKNGTTPPRYRDIMYGNKSEHPH